MPNLLLHCGGQAIERAELDRHPTPSPTGSWQPVPHATLLDLVERAFAHAGMNVVDQAHALGRDGDRYFGLMHLSVDRGNYEHDEAQDTSGNEYGFVAGIRNSHDRSFPASLVLGSVVFVCDNLAFSGEVVLARRHTRHITRDLPQLVDRAVGRLGELRVDQDRRLEAYRETPVTDPQAHHLLVSMLDSRVLPVTRLPAAIKEFREPRHDEFLGDGGRRTAWTLMNAVTESIKGRNLDQLPHRTQAMHGLLDSHCGLTAASLN